PRGQGDLLFQPHQADVRHSARDRRYPGDRRAADVVRDASRLRNRIRGRVFRRLGGWETVSGDGGHGLGAAGRAGAELAGWVEEIEPSLRLIYPIKARQGLDCAASDRFGNRLQSPRKSDRMVSTT